MDMETYQRLALDTMADQFTIQLRIASAPVWQIQLDNAVRGLCNEAGELADVTKRLLEYGKPATEDTITNIKEEVGDCFWRLRQACDAVGLTFEECMEANWNKLNKVRYPRGYSDFAAQEENRDRKGEAAAVSGIDLAAPETESKTTQTVVASMGIELYDPCPCGSDKKYKFCCAPKAQLFIIDEAQGVDPDLYKKASEFSRTKAKEERDTAKTPEEREGIKKEQYRAAYTPLAQQPMTEPGETGPTLPPTETSKVVEKLEEAVDSVIKRPPLSQSYDRYCVACNKQPIHRINTTGLCPNCAALKRAEESASTKS